MSTMSMPNDDVCRVAVIGGGAAGLMAAGYALREGAAVTIFEPNARMGRKLAITGKGRCNLTNACTQEELLQNVTRNARFLYAATAAFGPEDTMQLFSEELGVPLKTERGRRVFPVSDHAADIVAALCRFTAGAKVVHEKVVQIDVDAGRVCALHTAQGRYSADAVILATGGCSYPLTGSDGSGHALAAALGHTVTPLMPSLVPLTSPSPDCREMMGLSLRNVGLRILRDRDGHVLYQDFGEMLFTHFGLSGPMILSASAHLHGQTFPGLSAVIDMKPALDEKTLDARLQSDLHTYANRNFENALGDLLPSAMISVVVRRSGIDPCKKANSVTRQERVALGHLLKAFSVPLSGFRPIEEAIVTSGGVDVREVDPRSMRSKKVPGLFFAGEILDVDAYTGGYNLQIAFSTGVAAGTYAAHVKEVK